MAIGLFGTPIGAQSDQDIVDRIRQEQQIRNQRLTQGLGKYAGLAAQGMETAQGFNTDVGRIFGIQDPRLQKNTAIREAGEAVKARGVNMNDPVATLTAFSEELMKRGLYQEATALVPQIQQAQRLKAQDMQTAERTGMERERLGLEKQRVDIAETQAANVAARAEQEAAQKAMDVKEVGVTIKGIRVFRRGQGGLIVEQGGNEVAYDPAKHGRFETASDRQGSQRARFNEYQVKDITGTITGVNRVFEDGTTKFIPFDGGQQTTPGAAQGKLTDEQARELLKGGGGNKGTQAAAPSRQVANPMDTVPPAPPKYISEGRNRKINPKWEEWNRQYGSAAYQSNEAGGA